MTAMERMTLMAGGVSLTKNDGYCGHWSPDSHPEPDKFTNAWPLKLPEGKKAILTFHSDGSWSCNRCKEHFPASKKRPEHVCPI